MPILCTGLSVLTLEVLTAVYTRTRARPWCTHVAIQSSQALWMSVAGISVALTRREGVKPKKGTEVTHEVLEDRVKDRQQSLL